MPILRGGKGRFPGNRCCHVDPRSLPVCSPVVSRDICGGVPRLESPPAPEEAGPALWGPLWRGQGAGARSSARSRVGRQGRHAAQLAVAKLTPPYCQQGTLRIRGRRDFDIGSDLMAGHTAGLIISAKISSAGLRRRHTLLPYLHRIVNRLRHERMRAMRVVAKDLSE